MTARNNYIILLLTLFFTQLSSAQPPQRARPYFTSEEMPSMMKWQIAPPSDSSDEYVLDVKRYYWGKQMRDDKQRAAIAAADARYGLKAIIGIFSEPFGMQISPVNTPRIYILLRDALATTDSICRIPKSEYMRPRPFMVFGEPTLTPEDEPSLRKNGSWPSGHTILGFSAALLLSEINPEAADTLLARGLMYGESRVIVGAHWQSDVNAGLLAASVACTRLHTSERFLEDMHKARKEFEELKGRFPPVRNGTVQDVRLEKERSRLESIEKHYDCKVQRFTFGFDETTGLKLLFIRTNKCDAHVKGAVDNIVLTDKQDQVVYVVRSLIRHDQSTGDDDSRYGLHVLGRTQEGEIPVSEVDYRDILRFLLQKGRIPELVNCSSIRSVVSSSKELTPLHDITDNDRELYNRFFADNDNIYNLGHLSVRTC